MPVHQPMSDVTLEADVGQLNKMQVINADRNLLVSQWSESGEIAELARKSAVLRTRKGTVVRELTPADGKPGNGILQTFEKSVNMGLRLSFLRFRRNAKRIPLDERMAKHREPFDMRALRPHLRNPGWRRYRAKEE
jgi:hypothetical protein